MISSNVKSSTSRSDVSLMAIVPEREWSTPTLTVSSAIAVVRPAMAALARPAPMEAARSSTVAPD